MFIDEFLVFQKQFLEVSSKAENPLPLGKLFCDYFAVDKEINLDLYKEQNNVKALEIIRNRYLLH